MGGEGKRGKRRGKGEGGEGREERDGRTNPKTTRISAAPAPNFLHYFFLPQEFAYRGLKK